MIRESEWMRTFDKCELERRSSCMIIDVCMHGLVWRGTINKQVRISLISVSENGFQCRRAAWHVQLRESLEARHIAPLQPARCPPHSSMETTSGIHDNKGIALAIILLLILLEVSKRFWGSCQGYQSTVKEKVQIVWINKWCRDASHNYKAKEWQKSDGACSPKRNT